jgi:hypothetical protein
MTREDRALLREAIGWLKPGMHVSVRACDLLALLDRIDQAEQLADGQRRSGDTRSGT